jgi:hypothetical protein
VYFLLWNRWPILSRIDFYHEDPVASSANLANLANLLPCEHAYLGLWYRYIPLALPHLLVASFLQSIARSIQLRLSFRDGPRSHLSRRTRVSWRESSDESIDIHHSEPNLICTHCKPCCPCSCHPAPVLQLLNQGWKRTEDRKLSSLKLFSFRRWSHQLLPVQIILSIFSLFHFNLSFFAWFCTFTPSYTRFYYHHYTSYCSSHTPLAALPMSLF